MRFAICNELFTGWSFAEVCAYAARLGYAGVELAPFTVAPAGVEYLDRGARQALRQALRDAGVSLVGLHWLLVGPPGLHLTAADPAVRRRTAAYLLALTECCADLGGSVLVLGSPKQRQLEPGVSLAEGLQRAAECLQPAVERAQQLGVRWSLEPLPPGDTNFLNTLDEALALDRLLGDGPALGVQLDAKSLCAEVPAGQDPSSALLAHAAAAPRLAHFHANDRNLGAPGSGELDFVPLLRALRQIGYDGWISVEVFDFRAGPEAIAQGSLRYLQQALARAQQVP